eukprot:c7418_g1_i1.p1 GENE.c7418_g1_i1~~c7418_g1_i1.p1  ORF type:complete len:599 (-),score=125.07 c7418_g1_i1:165-1961(-)
MGGMQFVFWGLLVLACAAVAVNDHPAPTNVVILFLDDHGWSDVGCNNDTTTETPNIDELAKGGLRFTDFHAGASVCTPSRAALLTGRLGIRTGVYQNFVPFSKGGIPEGELTIADLMPTNFETHMIGKWHLGHNAPFHPSFRGFDTWFGLPYSGDLGCLDTTPQSCKPQVDRSVGHPECPSLCDKQNITVGIPLYNSTKPDCSGHASCNQDIIEQPVDETELNNRYATRAEQIIADAAGSKTSILLYIGFAHTHTPLTYDPRFANSSTRPGWKQIYGNTLAEVDDTVGRIHRALRDNNILNNTLLILAADNGPADLPTVDCDFIGSAEPFIGAWQAQAQGGGGGSTLKTTTWEGGHRVVSIWSWPGTITAGVTNALGSTLDILPTILSLLSTPLPSDRSFDGIDISSILLRKIAEEDMRNLLYAPEKSDETNTSSKFPLSFPTVSSSSSSEANANPYKIEGRVLFHPDANGQLTAVRIGSLKLYFQTTGAGKCNGGKVPTPIAHSPPLAFDLSSDPSESHPVSVSDKIVAFVTAVLEEKMKDVNSTLKHVVDYSQDRTAAACCNQSSSVCRCSGRGTYVSSFSSAVVASDSDSHVLLP